MTLKQKRQSTADLLRAEALAQRAPQPVQEPIRNRQDEMVQNHDGAYVFPITIWSRLRRWLVIGSETTFYQSGVQLTKENAKNFFACLDTDWFRTLDEIVYVSYGTDQDKRSLGTDNKICVWALMQALLSVKFGPEREERFAYGYTAAQRVIRGLPDFYYAIDLIRDEPGAFNRVNSIKLGIENGYKPAVETLRQLAVEWATSDGTYNKLERQIIQFGSRTVSKGGTPWSFGQAIQRLHPATPDPTVNVLFKYAMWKDKRDGTVLSDMSDFTLRGEAGAVIHVDWQEAFPIIWAYEQLRTETSRKRVINLIHDNKLPWEAVPDQWRDDKDVWTAMLPHMKLGALTRQLGLLTSKGIIEPVGQNINVVVEKLTSEHDVYRSRLHPLNWIKSLFYYQMGHSGDDVPVAKRTTWKPNTKVGAALTEGFYHTLKAVRPTGKTRCLALDCSGSMTTFSINGIPGFDARTAAAVMAMATLRAEKNAVMVGFASRGSGTAAWDRPHLELLDIRPTDRLEEVIGKIARVQAGFTHLSLPMQWAAENKYAFDSFEIYTDNEVNKGPHPAQYLKDYRKKYGADVKLAVAAFTAANFTIADPKDRGMADFPGLSSDTPSLITEFVAGNI
jgi:60 kDa SS-A/Ro ribonucleoprotein